MGDIDFLTGEDDHWRAGGDWGEVLIYTDLSPRVTVTDPSSTSTTL